MADFFSYGFFRTALLAGILTGFLCGVLSVLITIKRLSFIGQGISHAAFGGVAFGLLVGISPSITALFFAIVMAISISVLSKRESMQRDAIIGILLSAFMALGIIFLSMKKTYTGSVMGYLFGNILAVNRGDILWLIAATILSLGFISIFYKELQFYAFDEKIAHIYGIPVVPIQTALLVIVSVAIIASIRIVGVILVTAMLTAPGAMALLISKRYNSLFLIAPVAGIVAGVLGLVVSFVLNIPSGAAITLVLTIFYLLVKFIESALKKK